MSPTIWRIVGFLAAVEIASGILQGYYTPIYSDIADHLRIADGDVNWFEAAQLIVAALAVPVLSRLGDLHGHRRVLVVATMITAVGGWVVALAPASGPSSWAGRSRVPTPSGSPWRSRSSTSALASTPTARRSSGAAPPSSSWHSRSASSPARWGPVRSSRSSA
ncbi:MFS transporter [Janibacter indicus]|uniref:MFS transporter n=1 Tax=Janibacter indicus TaxID=857417 RepID=UPI000A798F8B|nr:MFS transporter [Janibacter indicus]